jgi:hypothetical protein
LGNESVLVAPSRFKRGFVAKISEALSELRADPKVMELFKSTMEIVSEKWGQDLSGISQRLDKQDELSHNNSLVSFNNSILAKNNSAKIDSLHKHDGNKTNTFYPTCDICQVQKNYSFSDLFELMVAYARGRPLNYTLDDWVLTQSSGMGVSVVSSILGKFGDNRIANRLAKRYNIHQSVLAKVTERANTEQTVV